MPKDYGTTSLHTMLVRVCGPSSQKYIKEETEQGVKTGFAEFDKVNQEVIDSIDWGKIKELIDEQLPEEWYCSIAAF